MIIRWVKNLQQAAVDREAAQRALDGDRIGPAEQKRIESQIEKANREIERYAERINSDLRRAAEERKPIRYPHGLDSIHDRALKDYVASVRDTISKLNHQIQIDGKRGDVYARSLEKRRLEALKVQDTSAKNQKVLKREDDKLARRHQDAERRYEQKKRDLEHIEREIGNLDRQRKKFEAERDRVNSIAEKKQLELRNLEGDYRALDAQKKHEQNRDRRDQVKQKMSSMDPQLGQLRDFVNQHIPFQRQQFAKIQEKMSHESSELRAARTRIEDDLKLLRQEMADIQKARKDMKKNLHKEEDRMAAIGASLNDLKRTQQYAKKYGISST